MAHVYRLVWDDWNEEHVALDHVAPREVEEIVDNRPFITRGWNNRYRLIGQTESGRLLTAFVAPRGGGEAYVITARDATREEQRAYQRR